MTLNDSLNIRCLDWLELLVDVVGVGVDSVIEVDDVVREVVLSSAGLFMS